jgi:tRNA/tmRNA/rRNA uracil-C5-methylase (TrmA/RlmC/RlmD family)
MKSGSSIPLTIETVAFGGDGLGRHEGRVVFVPFTAPGDEIDARLTDVKPGFARGIIQNFRKAGPDRETPPCPYYQNCGGCQYQHLTYAAELKIKEQQVRETLVRLGKIPEPPVLPILPSPQPYGYRNRITVHARDGKIGFHGVNPNKIVEVDKCLLAMPEVNDLLSDLQVRRPGEGHYSLRHPSLPPSAFFQTNQFLLQPLADLVTASFSSSSGTLVEGYCGGGFFTRHLVDRFTHVIGIESDGRSLRDAHRLNLPKIEWIEGRVEDHFAHVLKNLPASETSVLLDPPREGLEKSVREALLNHPVRDWVQVSCNPATLARDAKILQEKYTLVSVQPIDLFPRTAQIECVVRWKKRD